MGQTDSSQYLALAGVSLRLADMFLDILFDPTAVHDGSAWLAVFPQAHPVSAQTPQSHV